MPVADLNEQALRQVISEEMNRSGLGVRVRQLQGGAPLVSALPAGPVDGQEIVFVADAARGVLWHFRYRAASASIYKWEFVGGSPLYNEIVAPETTASATYVSLATLGPTIGVPLAGDFMVGIGAGVSNTIVAESWMSYDIGATNAVDADKVAYTERVAAVQKAVAVSRLRPKTFAAPLSLLAKYRVGGGTGQWQERWMSVLPVRVG